MRDKRIEERQDEKAKQKEEERVNQKVRGRRDKWLSALVHLTSLLFAPAGCQHVGVGGGAPGLLSDLQQGQRREMERERGGS